MEFISLGGWCGNKIGLKQIGYEEATLPFDYVRSSIEGIIDCIENDFINYFPKNIERDMRFPDNMAFLGEYIGFYHEDLREEEIIVSFKRKINRFHKKLFEINLYVF